MEQNKTSKYFKYAIGEIFLVMIGILLALQVNNWNQMRLNKKKEVNYINRFIEELATDTTMIERHIRMSKTHFHNGMRLDSIIHSGGLDGQNQISAKGVVFSAQYIGRMWMPQYNTNTYDDLINTGNFHIISDPKIANHIRWYYTNLPYDWNDTFNQRLDEYLRIMIELIPLKFHVAILAPESMPDIPNPETVLSDEEAIEILENIVAYPKIEFYVKNATRGHLYHVGLMEDLKEATTELINDLKKY